MDLYSFYKQDIIPQLVDKFRYTSIMQVPCLRKITINMGLGDSISNKSILESAVQDLTVISGQKPVFTYARKSLANFKIRKGQAIGCKVTLRGIRMWHFFERLIFIAIPRIRDFRGLSSKSFDNMGNYSLGVREQIIFPEIDYDKIDRIRGMDIAITIMSQSYDESYALLSAFNFPFRS